MTVQDDAENHFYHGHTHQCLRSFQTFSAVQTHVSISERGCLLRQASRESLLPKSLINAGSDVPVGLCESTDGVGLNRMDSDDNVSSLACGHSQVGFGQQGPQIMPKQSITVCERTNWADNLHTDRHLSCCGHALATSQSQTASLLTQRSEGHDSPPVFLPTSMNTDQSTTTHSVVEVAERELDAISIMRPPVNVNSQSCTPVLHEYAEPEQPLLMCCCLCGHCLNHCFSSKSTASNRCTAAHFLSSSCPPMCLSSSWCDWQWNRWRRRRIPNENLLVLSVIQLLCGFAAIILSSVALTKAVFLYQMATGMWAGFLMLITGTQGLIASRRPIVCTLTGLLTLCVVVTIAACLLICVSVAGTIEDGFLDHMNTRSRSQHQTIKLTYSFHPSTGGLQKSDQFYSLTYQGLPENRTVHRLSWGAVRQLYTDRASSHFVSSSQDTHLRTCQVILHVLLLLVGILESSVSLSTCVLCCRCVCSRSGRFGTSQNPFATRTNIVSLNAATANQAVSVLRSGELNQFIGSGNLLLAVSAGTPSDQTDPSLNLLRQTLSGMEPCIHPSVTPFLPQFNRPALILTQAGTGAMAWTAARAAATLVDRESMGVDDSCRTTTSSTDASATESTTVNPPRPGRLQQIFHPQFGRRHNRINRVDRPQLLFTSLSTLNNRNSVANQSNRGVQNSSAMVTGLPPCPPGSTLIYVMPSPNSDSPPMIFPPFPPVYSSLQKRPSVFNTPRRSGHGNRRNAHMHRNPTSATTTRSRGIRSSEYARPGRSITRQYLSRIFTWHRGSTRRSQRMAGTHHRRPSPSRTSNSGLICAGGNRLLQPVLIIEDPDIFQMNSTDPPPYSAIDQGPLSCDVESQDS
ncbi:hypothetical protein FGIG_00868 [Fasciola gigantica]|uniref:Uncharacterized protein n=1 Tax=Fasciola gigantica TaxID=46835 RepID=A0A504X0U9_FASGI|nr:hypothetical protein FGIG_00868 [Fasciola gigantica]